MQALSPEQNLQPPVEAVRDTQTDEELVERIREGDDNAAELLIRRYQEKAYAIAWSMCGRDREEAKDIVQDTFLKVLRNISKFQGKSSFYTWFYRILVNTCLDRRRRESVWKKIFFPWNPKQERDEDSDSSLEEVPDMSEDADPLKMLSGKEFGKEVQKVLDSLSEKQRTVFQLKVFHDMSIPEIAEVMNTAQGTVKSHLFRATRYLQEHLKEWRDMRV
ncbi:MAG: sigma-70 family RNA polymerase sigma factor [Desulfobacterales bacterium]